MTQLVLQCACLKLIVTTVSPVHFEVLDTGLAGVNATPNCYRDWIVSLNLAHRTIKCIEGHPQTLDALYHGSDFSTERSELRVEIDKTLEDLQSKRDDADSSARIYHGVNFETLKVLFRVQEIGSQIKEGVQTKNWRTEMRGTDCHLR